MHISIFNKAAKVNFINNTSKVLRNHPLFSAFLQEYREYARGEGVNPVVGFQ